MSTHVPLTSYWLGFSGLTFSIVQVLHVGKEVGHAPGDAVVVADDDARRPGEREPGDVERAARVLPRLQPPARSSTGPTRTRWTASGFPGADRWRGLACPDTVREPEMTQLLEPRPGASPSDQGSAESRALRQPGRDAAKRLRDFRGRLGARGASDARPRDPADSGSRSARRQLAVRDDNGHLPVAVGPRRNRASAPGRPAG